MTSYQRIVKYTVPTGIRSHSGSQVLWEPHRKNPIYNRVYIYLMTRSSAKPIVNLVSLLQFLYHSFPVIRSNFEEMLESLTIGIGGRGGVPVPRLVGLPISGARSDRVGPTNYQVGEVL